MKLINKLRTSRLEYRALWDWRNKLCMGNIPRKHQVTFLSPEGDDVFIIDRDSNTYSKGEIKTAYTGDKFKEWFGNIVFAPNTIIMVDESGRGIDFWTRIFVQASGLDLHREGNDALDKDGVKYFGIENIGPITSAMIQCQGPDICRAHAELAVFQAS
jgi:hypothetical protein